MTDGCLKRLVGFHLLGAFITDTAWRRERDSRQGTARHGTARLGVGVAVAVAVGVGMKREEEEGQGAAIAPHPPADDGGSRPAMASLAFRNLTVRSAGRERGSPLSLGGRIMGALGRAHPRDEAFTALKGAEGLMKPGTMMLVMGPPGSGKSSLLRALAGRLHPTEDLMSGDMAIDGVRVDSSHPSHSRRVVYVPPDDTSHTPAMTVRETFEFAAKCCGNSEMTDRVVEGFGLTRVADTVVGGDELRGVSGGQKRRVTVGEMAFSSDALFFCLDSITNGLDSATAYQVVKLCEKACRTQSKAAALSLLQPPQEVFDLFESVICLTPVGDMAFYGPRSAAVAYFEAATGSSCPAGMTSPEFIQSILSGLVPLRPLSSVTSSDRKQDSVPTLAGLWAGQSPARAELDGLLNEAFAAGEDRPPLTNPPSFRHGFWKQMELCLGRRFIVVLRNEMTVRRPIVALLFGLVTGTLFFQLPNNLMGTISASGLLFLSLFLTLMLSAAVVLPGNFRQRVTYFKHRNAGFYSTPAYYLSTWISDLPLAILEALLLSLVTYFLAGLRPGAQFYFFFFGILVATECVGQAWGRLISALCPSEVMANVLTTGYIFTCGLVSGFMPGYNALGWAKFLNWLSPVSYGFEAIMLNQFSGRPVYLFLGINGDLEASEISIPGTDMLSAAWNVPRIPFDEAPPGMRSPAQLKAFDMAMMFIFSLVLDASACYLLDVSRRWYGPRARRVQLEMGGGIIKDVLPCQGGEEVSGEPPSSTAAAVVEEDVMLTAASLIYEVDVPKGNEDEKPEQDKEEKDAQESLEDGAVASASTGSQASSEGDQSLSTPDTNATYGQRRNLTLQWGLTYILNAHRFLRRRGNDHKKGSKAPTKQGTKRLRLLDQVTVAFKGGEMTALMGESGAGKTTLLDVIAGYKTGGHITGDIRINGRPKDVATWQRTSGYCEQSDIHNPYLSLRESLEFGASCRLPAKMTEKERHTRVDEVIDLMQLREYESMVIGSEANGEGLPKHARKRLTIALELIPGPKVLFLDEPTTGLDGISARLVMSSVRQSSDRLRVCVVCTIHQPSRSLFEIFDNLLLLKRGGRTVYNGPIGPNSETVISYFSSLHPDISFEQGENPADFALSVVEAKRPGTAGLDLITLYSSSLPKNNVDSLVAEAYERGKTVAPWTQEPKPTFWAELQLVTRRQFTSLLRNEGYSNTRTLWSLFCALILGFIFFRLPGTLNGAVLRIGAIFFAVYTSTVAMQSSVVPMISERAVVYREVSSGTYSHYAYAVGSLFADIPWHALSALIFLIIYPLMGFKSGDGEAGYFFIIIFLAYWVLPSIGQLFAAVSPNVESANGLAGLAAILSSLTMGFLMPYGLMPPGWQWSYWVNVLRYILQGLCINELAGSIYSVDLTALLGGITDIIYLPGPGVEIEGIKDTINESLQGVKEEIVSGISSAIEASVGESLIGCMFRNSCTDSAFAALRCFNSLCADEFAQAGQSIGDIRDCVDSERATPLGCVLGATVPDGVIDAAQRLQIIAELIPSIVEGLSDAKGIIVEASQNFPVPGNVILFFFSWADAEKDPAQTPSISFSATTKWYYCMFAVFVFLLCIEIMKIFSIRYICWIKR